MKRPKTLAITMSEVVVFQEIDPTQRRLDPRMDTPEGLSKSEARRNIKI